MTESQINKYIDKLRYRTFKKVAPNVFKKFPNVDKKTIKEIINCRSMVGLPLSGRPSCRLGKMFSPRRKTDIAIIFWPLPGLFG